jgi:phage antirepressor YoqD-like protein
MKSDSALIGRVTLSEGNDVNVYLTRNGVMLDRSNTYPVNMPMDKCVELGYLLVKAGKSYTTLWHKLDSFQKRREELNRQENEFLENWDKAAWSLGVEDDDAS